MNLVRTRFDRSTPLNLGGAADQLGFLLGQLDGDKVEAIVAKIEVLAGVAGDEHPESADTLQDLSSYARVQQATARILYAVAGMSYVDRVFALTFAEIQALLDGANDDCFETRYCQ